MSDRPIEYVLTIGEDDAYALIRGEVPPALQNLMIRVVRGIHSTPADLIDRIQQQRQEEPCADLPLFAGQ